MQGAKKRTSSGRSRRVIGFEGSTSTAAAIVVGSIQFHDEMKQIE